LTIGVFAEQQQPQYGRYFFLTKGIAKISFLKDYCEIKGKFSFHRRIWFQEHLPIHKGNFYLPVYVPQAWKDKNEILQKSNLSITVDDKNLSFSSVKQGTMPSAIPCPKSMKIAWFKVNQSDIMKTLIAEIKSKDFNNDSFLAGSKQERKKMVQMKRKYEILQLETDPKFTLIVSYRQTYFEIDKDKYLFYLPLLSGNIGNDKNNNVLHLHATKDAKITLDTPNDIEDAVDGKSMKIYPRDFLPVIVLVTG
jgi:hypothetical protein